MRAIVWRREEVGTTKNGPGALQCHRSILRQDHGEIAFGAGAVHVPSVLTVRHDLLLNHCCAARTHFEIPFAEIELPLTLFEVLAEQACARGARGVGWGIIRSVGGVSHVAPSAPVWLATATITDGGGRATTTRPPADLSRATTTGASARQSRPTATRAKARRSGANAIGRHHASAAG